MKKEYATLRKKLETYFHVSGNFVCILFVVLGSVVKKLSVPFCLCSWLGKLGPWRQHLGPSKVKSLRMCI